MTAASSNSSADARKIDQRTKTLNALIDQKVEQRKLVKVVKESAQSQINFKDLH